MLHYTSFRQWSTLSLIFIGICLLGISPFAQAAPQETLQVAQFHSFATEALTPGVALLNRTRNDLWVTAHLSGLDANAAYTLWAVIFNHPAPCITNLDPVARCGGNDLVAIPNVTQSSIVHLTGFIADSSGTANVVGHLHSGTVPAGTDVPLGAGGNVYDNGVKPGLFPGKGFKAEVHFVVRSHGPIILEAITEQLSKFDGDCMVCVDQLIARFPRLQN